MSLYLLLKNLILPPCSPLLLGGLGIALWPHRPRFGMTCCTVCIVCLWVLSSPVVVERLTDWEQRYPALDLAALARTGTDARAVVILGQGFRNSAPEIRRDAPSDMAVSALVEGAMTARAGGLPILLTGTPRETRAMRDFLSTNLGVEPRWIESASNDTHGNAVNTARVLQAEGIRRVILVTSGVHMPRSMDEFRAAGMSADAAPAAIWTHQEDGLLRLLPSARAMAQSHDLVYEWTGQLVRRVLLRCCR